VTSPPPPHRTSKNGSAMHDVYYKTMLGNEESFAETTTELFTIRENTLVFAPDMHVLGNKMFVDLKITDGVRTQGCCTLPIVYMPKKTNEILHYGLCVVYFALYSSESKM
jgi:hypothetical protein